jgi:hypothetical protein
MLLLTILKKTAILIILSLVCLSAFGQDYLNPSYRQGFAAEVEAGYICKGAYTNFSLGYNIIYERACTGDDPCTIGLIYRF